MTKKDEVYEEGELLFTGKGEAEQAKREEQGIAYIKEQNDLSDSKVVLALYNKLKEKEIFKTSVGKKFLADLKQQLVEDTSVDSSMIYGYDPEEERKKQQEIWAQKQEERAQKEREKPRENVYRYRFYNSLIVNVILVIAIIVLFILTTNSKNVNILNYENRLIQRYSDWEASLIQREQLVREKEQALGIDSEKGEIFTE